MKKYIAPELTVETFAADTMIASGADDFKNGNAGNNQNCWGCRLKPGAGDEYTSENACAITPDENPIAYGAFC